MKKLTLLAGTLLLSTLSLSANSTGQEIFDANCKSCHMMKPMMDKEKMSKMSKADRMSMMEKMMKNMKAPPMSKVSSKIKHELKDDKKTFVAFVKDYIVNPTKEKSKCMPMALEKFGVMPPIGKTLSKADLETVANWMYDSFNEKWDPNAMGMMCNTGKGMKCGGDKGKSAHKCGAEQMKAKGGKCGADEKTTHKTSPKKESKAMKCSAGKCGSK